MAKHSALPRSLRCLILLLGVAAVAPSAGGFAMKARLTPVGWTRHRGDAASHNRACSSAVHAFMGAASPSSDHGEGNGRSHRRAAVRSVASLPLIAVAIWSAEAAAATSSRELMGAGGASAAVPGLIQRAQGYGKGDFKLLARRAAGGLLDIDSPGFGYDACFGLCSEKQLFYPKWMAGEWEVTSEYVAKAFPKGEQLVYRNVRAGSARSESEAIGDKTVFAFRYRAVPRRQKDHLPVVQDRAFNTASMLNAYAGYRRVNNIEYFPDKDPTRMVMNYPTVDPRDMRPLPPKRTEVFINNRDGAASPDGNSFACSELFRAVTLGAGTSAVADSENASLFVFDPATGVISGTQRSMIYLVPSPNSREGDLYMQTGGKAVAVYDYKITMRPVDDVAKGVAGGGGEEASASPSVGDEEEEGEGEDEE